MVASITPARVDEFIDSMRDTGMSQDYLSTILSTFRAALRRAYQQGHVTQCPFVRDVQRRDPAEQRWLLPDEASRLVDASAATPHCQLFIVLAISTGARPGAILELDRKQIDMRGRLIYLNPPGRQQTAKRRAIVPISDTLAEYLDPRLPASGQLFGMKSIKRSFRSAVIRSGLDPDEVTPKTLRHTFASWAMQEGEGEWYVARMLGHRDTRMVNRTYAHHSPDHLRSVADAAARNIRIRSDKP